jgi:hypothetical protein
MYKSVHSVKKIIWEAEGNNGPEVTAYFNVNGIEDEPFGYREFGPNTLPRSFLLEVEAMINRMVTEFTRDWK